MGKPSRFRQRIFGFFAAADRLTHRAFIRQLSQTARLQVQPQRRPGPSRASLAPCARRPAQDSQVPRYPRSRGGAIRLVRRRRSHKAERPLPTRRNRLPTSARSAESDSIFRSKEFSQTRSLYRDPLTTTNIVSPSRRGHGRGARYSASPAPSLRPVRSRRSRPEGIAQARRRVTVVTLPTRRVGSRAGPHAELDVISTRSQPEGFNDLTPSPVLDAPPMSSPHRASTPPRWS